MKIAGEYRFAAPRTTVWQAMLDPAILARSLPGCEQLERVGETDFRGALNVQVGPVKGQFQGTLALSDVVAHEGYRVKLDGSGPAGFMRGEGTLRLVDAEGGTLLAYDLDAQVGGRVAGVGQRLLDSSARVITRQGLEGFDRQVQALHAATGASAAGGATVPPGIAAPAVSATVIPPALSAAPPAPSQAAFAARFARDLAIELVPRQARPWLLLAALVAAFLLGALVQRGCALF